MGSKICEGVQTTCEPTLKVVLPIKCSLHYYVCLALLHFGTPLPPPPPLGLGVGLRLEMLLNANPNSTALGGTKVH